jgi:hypothetical protein
MLTSPRSKLGSLLPSYDAKPYQHMVELFCKSYQSFIYFYNKNNNLNLIKTK